MRIDSMPVKPMQPVEPQAPPGGNIEHRRPPPEPSRPAGSEKNGPSFVQPLPNSTEQESSASTGSRSKGAKTLDSGNQIDIYV